MIDQTLYLDTETSRKQVTMDRWAYDLLKSTGSESLTKSLVSYEALMFANPEYEDALNQIESSVDDQLASVATDSFSETVEKIKNSEQYIDTDDTDRLDRVNLQIPVSVLDDISELSGINRGIGDHIADAVHKMHTSAYADRADRINAKQQLISYIEEDDHPSHEVAIAVVDGDDTVYSVLDAHAELQKIIGETEVWERDDLNKENLLEEDVWNDIPATKEKRVEAIQTVIDNESLTESQVIDLIDNFALSAPTRRDYIANLEFEDEVEIDAREILNKIYQEEVTTSVDLSLRNHFSGPAEVATITNTESYEALDGSPLTRSEAEQYIDDVTDSYDDDLLLDEYKEKQMMIRSRLKATLRLELD